LFNAAVKYGNATGEHPLAALGRWAQDSPVNTLQQAHAIAPVPVQVFTDGLDPERISQNRFALSQLLAKPPGKRVPFAIDEMPTVGLPNLTGYLATVGGWVSRWSSTSRRCRRSRTCTDTKQR